MYRKKIPHIYGWESVVASTLTHIYLFPSPNQECALFAGQARKIVNKTYERAPELLIYLPKKDLNHQKRNSIGFH